MSFYLTMSIRQDEISFLPGAAVWPWPRFITFHSAVKGIDLLSRLSYNGRCIFASFMHTEGVMSFFNEHPRSLEYRKKRTIICNQRKEWGGFKFWIRHFWTVSRPTCTEIVSSSSDHFDEMKKRLAACATVCFFSKHPPTTTAALRLLLRGLMSQLMQRYEHQPDSSTSNLFSESRRIRLCQ